MLNFSRGFYVSLRLPQVAGFGFRFAGTRRIPNESLTLVRVETFCSTPFWLVNK